MPAIVYGQGADPEPVAVPSRDLQHILAGAGGANTLINLDLSGREESCWPGRWCATPCGTR